MSTHRGSERAGAARGATGGASGLGKARTKREPVLRVLLAVAGGPVLAPPALRLTHRHSTAGERERVCQHPSTENLGGPGKQALANVRTNFDK